MRQTQFLSHSTKVKNLKSYVSRFLAGSTPAGITRGSFITIESRFTKLIATKLRELAGLETPSPSIDLARP
jgi:hypothetical protein